MNQISRTSRTLVAVAIWTLLLPACLSEDAEPTIDMNAPAAPGTAITISSPTPPPTTPPTPTAASWLQTLIESGTAGRASPVAFFRNGPDLWLVANDLSVRQVSEGRRVRLAATRPGHSSAAVLLLGSAGGRETEEIRLIDIDGSESDPIYGPEIVGAPAGNPGVSHIEWSPDGELLAVARQDGSVWLAGPDQQLSEQPISRQADDIESVRWSPASNALLLLLRGSGGEGYLRVVPLEGEGFHDIPPHRSFGAAAWLPASARLIVAEDGAAGFNPNAGSLLTILPDGTDQTLLISAGEFGPAVQIGRILPSPDGAHVAFTVETPGPDGAMSFQSLRLLETATGIQRSLETAPGHAVSDLWWAEVGLAWRGIASTSDSVYDGVEPFSIEFHNLETAATALVFTSDAAR